MTYKLSALALGIGVMFGAGSALADTAVMSQTGSWNDSTIEQYDNNGAYASITVNGFNNDAVVVQQDVNNANAVITQTANSGDASIDQSGSSSWYHTVRGNNHSATLNQLWGWDNTGVIRQRGDNVTAFMNQGGSDNDATILQKGGGYGLVMATVNQAGSHNDAVVNQDGRHLTATINQWGKKNDATILQTKSGHIATLTQVGAHNTGLIIQR